MDPITLRARPLGLGRARSRTVEHAKGPSTAQWKGLLTDTRDGPPSVLRLIAFVLDRLSCALHILAGAGDGLASRESDEPEKGADLTVGVMCHSCFGSCHNPDGARSFRRPVA